MRKPVNLDNSNDTLLILRNLKLKNKNGICFGAFKYKLFSQNICLA